MYQPIRRLVPCRQRARNYNTTYVGIYDEIVCNHTIVGIDDHNTKVLVCRGLAAIGSNTNKVVGNAYAHGIITGDRDTGLEIDQGQTRDFEPTSLV